MLPKHRKVSHPGEILRELYVEPLGITQQTLSKHLGCTRVAINEILNGHRGITPQMAFRLADAFGTSPELWMNLQRDYDLQEARKHHKRLPSIA
ncbi:MAG: HigA family addiction module antitoxin [Vampirovibrionales bacterium]|nr:HigA family addiction module antitoxin [Vampirovibrionales bacterium]